MKVHADLGLQTGRLGELLLPLLDQPGEPLRERILALVDLLRSDVTAGRQCIVMGADLIERGDPAKSGGNHSARR